MNRYSIEIERIVLTGLGIAPDRAEHIRALVSAELRRLWMHGEGLDGLSGGETHSLSAPPVHVTGPGDERHIAHQVAQSIVRAVQDAGAKTSRLTVLNAKSHEPTNATNQADRT